MNGAGAEVERVNLFVLGAQKAGTTALWHWLAQQPGITAPKKEPHFFDRNERYRGGSDDALATYHRPFISAATSRYRVDCTPSYLYLPAVAGRLARYNPEARLIVLLRHPADRAISHWAMERRKGKESLPLVPALLAEPLRRRGGTHRVYSYLHRGFYSEQLARLLQFFPRDQLLLLRSETMRRQPAAVASEVARFLKLPAGPVAAIGKAHEGSYRSPHPLVRRALQRFYQPELARLALRYQLSWDDLTTPNQAAGGA